MSSVVAIFVAERSGSPMSAVQSVDACAGRGLVGDRYFTGEGPGRGTYSKASGARQASKPREVTLIEEEAIEAARRDHGVELDPAESRRNILTRGVALNHLVGREFMVGGARLRGVELCEPCGYLERLTRPGVREALIHRGGLRCAVIGDGTIAAGDRISVEPSMSV